MKIHELLDVPSKWTKWADARAHGVPIQSSNPMATCWCLRGAITKCYGDSAEIITVTQKIIDELKLSNSSITYWNDHPKRTHQEVLEVCKKLDI